MGAKPFRNFLVSSSPTYSQNMSHKAFSESVGFPRKVETSCCYILVGCNLGLEPAMSNIKPSFLVQNPNFSFGQKMFLPLGLNLSV
jgi:hypothetical protein